MKFSRLPASCFFACEDVLFSVTTGSLTKGFLRCPLRSFTLQSLVSIWDLSLHTDPYAPHLQPFQPPCRVSPWRSDLPPFPQWYVPATEPSLCSKNSLDALCSLICTSACQVGVTVYLAGEETELWEVNNLTHSESQATTPVLSGFKSQLWPLSGFRIPEDTCFSCVHLEIFFSPIKASRTFPRSPSLSSLLSPRNGKALPLWRYQKHFWTGMSRWRPQG